MTIQEWNIQNWASIDETSFFKAFHQSGILHKSKNTYLFEPLYSPSKQFKTITIQKIQVTPERIRFQYKYNLSWVGVLILGSILALLITGISILHWTGWKSMFLVIPCLFAIWQNHHNLISLCENQFHTFFIGTKPN